MTRKETFIKASSGGLTVLAYPGDDSVLLAFDLDAKPGADFAGFAIRCTPPHGRPYYLYNRLNLSQALTAATKPAERRYTPSNHAPFQKFRWIHVPKEMEDGDYVYEASTVHFRKNGGLGLGPSVSLCFEMTPEKYANFDIGFTRGYISSQAYVNKFKNAPIRPPGSSRAKVVPFAFLNDKVPAPFQKEYRGGQGQVIHHKFVVVDFNDSVPIVFTGSSNLAAGGEEANGDNLIAIFDRGIATAYGVEAVRLLDHYDFRKKMKDATTVKPLVLAGRDTRKPWWTPYYDSSHIKFQDRLLFSRPAKEK